MSPSIFVNGAEGKMGKMVVHQLEENPKYKIVGRGKHGDSLKEQLEKLQPDIAIDFTIPAVAYTNAKIIIEAGVRPVIGTTGFTLDQIEELQKLCQQKKLGGVIAPNFAIGVILMMQCAARISRYMPDVSIVELHQPKKLDAPSGTAKKTAELIAKARTHSPQISAHHNAALGLDYHGVPVHSIRIPGLIASEEVIFGAQGQTLVLRHDTFDRNAFMPGILLACQKVMEMKELIYGLEHLIEL